MKNQTHLNILVSYAYMTSPQFRERVCTLARESKINVMIDSGAFTKYNAASAFSHVNLDAYCDFLQKYGDIAEKYVMLDVIGNAKESHRNYETMIARGLSPMFVVTMFDKDFNYMREAVNRNPDICVAGGATTKSAWMMKRYQDIYLQSNCKARIHGLAYVTYPTMLQLPLASVDSSSWKASCLRFGSMQYFENGLKHISYKDVLTHKKSLTPKQQHILQTLHVTPKMYCNKEYHKGNFSIEALGSIKANIELQKVCKRNHLDYFLAINNQIDMEKLLYVNDNIYELNYEDFRKEFKK